MEKEFLIQSPRDYLTWLLHILCIHNQNRLLFKGNPISNGFNLEKQQKANKSSEAGPRKALWLLHVWRPDPVERFGRAASLSSEFAVLRDVGWAPGRLLANFCPGINYTDCVPVWAKLGIIEMLALLTDLIFGKRVLEDKLFSSFFLLPLHHQTRVVANSYFVAHLRTRFFQENIL